MISKIGTGAICGLLLLGSFLPNAFSAPRVPAQTNLGKSSTYPLQLNGYGGMALNGDASSVIQGVHDSLETGDVAAIMAMVLPSRPEAEKSLTRSLLSDAKIRLSLLKAMSTHPSGEASVTTYPGFLSECHWGLQSSVASVMDAKFLGLSVSKNVRDQCNEMESYRGVGIWFATDQSPTHQFGLGGVFFSVPSYQYCGRVNTSIDTVKIFLSDLKGSCKVATSIFNSYLKTFTSSGTVAPKSVTVSGWSCSNVLGHNESPFGRALYQCNAGTQAKSPVNSTIQVVRPPDVILPITLKRIVGAWSTHAGYLHINSDGSGEMSYPLADPVKFTNNFPTIKFSIQKILIGRAQAIVKASDEKTVPRGSLVWFSRTEEGLKASLVSGDVEIFCDARNQSLGLCGA